MHDATPQPLIHRSEEQSDCLIVGAGIAGLLAATVLKAAGLRCCVLEKSRGLGGRMATRRRDGAVFDHGAQFITVRDDRFRVWMDRWIELGLLAPWYELGDAGMHYRAVPGMTAIAKHLAKNLEIRRQTRVQQVSYDGSHWILRTAAGSLHTASAMLLTAPVPQSLDLLAASQVELDPAEYEKLQAIGFRRCIVALAILDRPSDLSTHNGALKLHGEPVQWIGDSLRKGISPAVPSVTIQSTPCFAENHWDVQDSARLPKLLEAAAPHLKAGVVSCEGHRWGFSEPVTAYGKEVFIDPTRRLAIAGDGLTGGRIEGAALSGLAAAEELINLLRARRHAG